MATTTPNLGLDTGLVGGGEQLRQALSENFKKIDAALAENLPAATVADNGKVLTIVAGVPAWVTPA